MSNTPANLHPGSLTQYWTPPQLRVAKRGGETAEIDQKTISVASLQPYALLAAGTVRKR